MKKLRRITFFKVAFYFFLFVGLYFWLSWQLTRIPPGINFDEASIGYNACLISDNLRDETGRFLPVFILTLDGKDWKQPVNVYAAAFLFKIFGKSYFNLRLVSVIFALVSGLVFWRLLRLFFSELLSLAGLLLFFSSPSILIQSHLVLENIAILPFFILWLYFLFAFSQRPKIYKVFLSGIFLGIDIYAYKGARALIPVYLGLSLLFLFFRSYTLRKRKNAVTGNLKQFKDIFKPMMLFLLGIMPFVLPLKWLNIHYLGAIYDPAVISNKFASFYESALIYFSSFDFSFLFVKGDSMLTHSTTRHGIFLAPTFFLFFLGLFQMVKEKRPEYYFVLISLALTPFLLMTVGSIYRASRLMVYIPLATIIFTLGVKKLSEIKPIILRGFIMIFFGAALLATYYDFASWYFNPYPKRISGDFSPNFDSAFKILADLAKETGKSAFIEDNDFRSYKSEMQFFKEVYFTHEKPEFWVREKEPFPENGLVLTSIGGSGQVANLAEIPSLQSGQKTFFIVGEK
ncbi:MAG: hypothetical protein BWY24_00478 [Microgenomates group bacterium ADurb.Bin219]|nr:MAG: hypothetical protein BWY24_00478 [Microgenomates group bacterium ADurb.Bin219]